MSKQTINIGQTPNDRTGDPLRTAFEKINANFTELYANDAADFDGNYNSLTNKPTIPTLSAVDQHIIPDTDVTYDLGSPTNRFRTLYLSGNTINLGSATISTDPITGNIQFSGGLTFNDTIIDEGLSFGFKDNQNNITFVRESGLEDPISEIYTLPTPVGPFPTGVNIMDLGSTLAREFLIALLPPGDDTFYEEGFPLQVTIYLPVLDENDFLTGIRVLAAGIPNVDGQGNIIDYPQGPIVAFPNAESYGGDAGSPEFIQWANANVINLGIENVTGDYVRSVETSVPKDVADLTDTTNLLGGSASTSASTGSIVSGNLELDFSHSAIEVIHNANITSITASPAPAVGQVKTITVFLTQDITGGRTISGNFFTSDGLGLNISTDSMAVNIVTFLTLDGGTTFYAFSNGKNFL